MRAAGAWQETRLKNLFTSVRNGVWGDDPDGEADVFCARGTDFDRTTNRISGAQMPRRNVTAGALRDHQLRRGDLVLEKSGGSADQPVGSVALFDLDSRTVCSNFNARMQVSRAVDSSFACYLMNGLYWSGFTRQFIKQTTGIQNLDAGAFLAQRCKLPSVDEQQRIADFLDAETSRIDRLLALRRQTRSAVMLRTTAQLDVTVENLAEMYGTSPFRRVISSIEQGSSPQCDNVAADPDSWGVLKVSAVKNGCFVQEENKQLPAGVEPERCYEIKHGDLLVTRANTPNLVGAAAIAESPRSKLMLCDKIFRIKTTQDLIPEFLVLVSLSTRVRSTCAEASHGTSASMVNLKTDEIKRWPIPRAPVSVQLDVVDELAATREFAAAAVDAIDRQVALLAERRQALITAAVTGQLDVTTARGAAV